MGQYNRMTKKRDVKERPETNTTICLEVKKKGPGTNTNLFITTVLFIISSIANSKVQ